MPDPLARTDEELVEDFLHGEDVAFRHLIERFHDPLIRFLFRLTGQREMAEDVFQDTFLQVHQSIESFDPTRRFKPWLFTIAANKARDALRRAHRRRAMSLSGSASDDEDSAPIDLADLRIPAVETRLAAEEQGAMVQRAIDQMSPRLREVLLMAYFQRLTYQQIAEQYGIPVGTVKSRLHAAVASFADHWKRQVREAQRRADSTEHPG
jgi:RNA polymerase sigma-70 factor (ECF subfamily)